MDWDEQFKQIRSKIETGLMGLKRLKNILLQSQLYSVYYGLVESLLRYGDVDWGSLNKAKKIALQGLIELKIALIENARIKDNWSRSLLNVDNVFHYDKCQSLKKIIIINSSCLEKGLHYPHT